MKVIKFQWEEIKYFFFTSEAKEIISWTNITTKPVVEKVVNNAIIVIQNMIPLFLFINEVINRRRLRKIWRTPGSQKIPWFRTNSIPKTENECVFLR